MLKRLTEEDVMALRIPFESLRQSPNHLGTILLITVPMNILLFVLIYLVLGEESVLPNQGLLFKVHLAITIILSIMSIIFAIPSIYRRSQKLQYLVTIIVTQTLFTFNFFIITLFISGSGKGLSVDEATVLRIMVILIITGILLFTITAVRFWYLLQKGEYRRGSRKDFLRMKMEGKQLIGPVIVAGTGLSLILQNVKISFMSMDANILTILVSGPLVYYLCIFILPEQLVLLYCKFRFKSFNYDSEGNLIPATGEGKIENEL